MPLVFVFSVSFCIFRNEAKFVYGAQIFTIYMLCDLSVTFLLYFLILNGPTDKLHMLVRKA